MALHTWSASLERQHRATLAKFFSGICAIQGVLSFSFALMKLFLCCMDKVLFLWDTCPVTVDYGLWGSRCQREMGAQPGRQRTSDGLSVLWLQEAPLGLKDLHFPLFLLGTESSLESKSHFQKVFSSCTPLPVLSSTVALSSFSFNLPAHISSLFIFHPSSSDSISPFLAPMVLLLLPFLSHTFLSN